MTWRNAEELLENSQPVVWMFWIYLSNTSPSFCYLPFAYVSRWLSFSPSNGFSWQKPRDSSVEVRSDWEVKEEMDFPQLMKMRYLEVSEPQDM